MKILVHDIAARDGGGVIVLKDFYREILQKQPEGIEWVFLIAQDFVRDAEHIKVLLHEEAQKSRIRRIFFDNFTLPRILREEQPDLVISLQNSPIRQFSGRQLVYLHQSLQFCPKKFSFLKREERATAIRQHIICNLYRHGLPRAEHIFVQTQWIREATVRWLNWPQDKITVVPMEINLDKVPRIEYTGTRSRTFFYPAREEIYKNHSVIVEACRKLEQEGIRDYRVIFTLDAGQGPYAEEIIRSAQGLPIEFIGYLPYQEIWQHYADSVLVFPSYLETCGMPMLEARAMGAWILASDMPFSHEALDDYPNKMYFPYNSAEILAEQMKDVLRGKTCREAPRKEQSAAAGLMETMLSRI